VECLKGGGYMKDVFGVLFKSLQERVLKTLLFTGEDQSQE